MGREELLTSIQNMLSVFQHKIKTANSNNELSLNVQSENSIGNILNEVCNYELVNSNLGEKNSKAVDLIDRDKQVAFQITATSTADKVYRTIIGFLESPFISHNYSLYIFILGTKGNYNQERINEMIRTKLKSHSSSSRFHFDVKEHILDIDDLYRMIANIVDLNKIRTIKHKIDDEFHSLSELLNSYETKRREIFFSFSDNDLDIALQIIESIVEEKIHIIHNSEKLDRNTALSESTRKFLRFSEYRDIQNNNSGHCLVLITQNYGEKWNRFGKCPILDYCIKKQTIIFPYVYGPVDSAFIKMIPLPKIPFRFSEDDLARMIHHLIKQILDNQPIEYKNFQMVLEMSESMSAFKQIALNRPMGYEIFEKLDNLTGDKFYIICFHRKALQEGSFQSIKESYPGILKEGRFNIILIKDDDQKDISIRKDNFRKLFGPRKIWYIDEFVYEFCTSKEFQDKLQVDKQQAQYFVMPHLQDEKANLITQNDLRFWLEKNGTPIMVLKGSGGIGKTTLAYEIERLYLKSKPNAKCIFIEAANIINTLRDKRVSDFYSIYKLSYEEDDGKLSQDRFRVNFDNGNILIIIDGIDEIIAKVNSFEVSRFIETVLDFTNELKNGKIVITCRDFFWKPPREDSDGISVIDIQPFSEKLAREFFSKRHESMPSIVNKCMRIAHSFYGSHEQIENIEFLPFVLDVVDNQVRYIIESELNVPDITQYVFESEVLNFRSESDFILYNICNRERVKLNQESVDSQIQLFTELALISNKQPGLRFTTQSLFIL